MNILFIGDIMGRTGRDAVFDLLADIKDEYSYPLVYMDKDEMRKCAFRVIVFRNRIAVEFFHSLTDGSGALIFLKNLVKTIPHMPNLCYIITSKTFIVLLEVKNNSIKQ